MNYDTEFEDVKALHEKFGLLVGSSPGHLTQEKAEERVRFLQEELDEFKEALQTNDLAKQLDALIDLVYVAKGTAVMLGIQWDEHWDEVHRANLSKVRGIGKRGNKVDLIKPDGWRPPDHNAILESSGYERDTWVDRRGELFIGRGDLGVES